MNYRIVIKTILFAALFIPAPCAMAQTVSGTVWGLDEHGHKDALPGVNLYWIGASAGTTTNADGRYKISRKGIANPLLVVSFLGYKTDTFNVANLSALDITLKESANSLKEVEVKSRSGTSFISQVNARKVQVITGGELRKAACCNLAESFETNASVDVMYADAVTGAKQIQMLGLSGVYSQVLGENVPLVRGLASSFGLGYIPGTWMESILVSKGASSVVNGFESTTGQIMVEYLKPMKSEKLFVNLFGNSNQRLEANAHSALKINDKLGTMLFGHYSSFNSPFDRNSDGFMDIPKNRTVNLMNRWDLNIPDRFTSHMIVKFFDETRTGGSMNYDAGTFTRDTSGISEGTKPYGIDMHTRRLEGSWKNGLMFASHPDRSVALIVSGILHSQNDKPGLSAYDAAQQSLYASLLYQDRLGNPHHKFITGLSLMADKYREKYRRTDFTYLYQQAGVDTDNIPDSLYTLTGFRDTTYNFDRKELVPGAFFEYTLNLDDKFTWIAGLRVDHHNVYGTFFTPRMHLRYKPTSTTTLRASAGKGYRTANVLAENYALMASQRTLHFAGNLQQENAWNLGLNATQDLKLFGREAQLDAEMYHTSFRSQVIVDFDSTAAGVFIYNLSGKSYSNILQLQFTFEPVKQLTVLAAFRLNDVFVTEGRQLLRKAMTNRYKGLLNMAYTTKFDKWKFDATLQLNGKARIPGTGLMPAAMQRPANSPAYIQLLAQVTRKFKYIEMYAGGENLTNYTQLDPLVEADHPYHTHFDTSMVWGPIVGATVYTGLRYSIK